MRQIFLALIVLLLASASLAQEAVEDSNAKPREDVKAATDNDASQIPAAGEDPNSPKTMSGMSILGNEEAPKSLIIIPWKASEIGSDLGLDDGLDARAEPVDREVFLRELEFYEIRSGE